MLELTALTSFQPVDSGRLAPKHDPYFFERWLFRSDEHWERPEGVEIPALPTHAAESFVHFAVMAQMAHRMRTASLVQVQNSTHVIPVRPGGGHGAVPMKLAAYPDGL